MGKSKKNRDQNSTAIALRGKKNRFIGLGDKHFECPTCSRRFKRGMVSEYKGILYCSEKCLPEV